MSKVLQKPIYKELDSLDLTYWHKTAKTISDKVIVYYPWGDPEPPGYTVILLLQTPDNTALKRNYWLFNLMTREFLKTTLDPLYEKNHLVNAFAFCAGDPVNFVDPDGRDWYYAEDDQMRSLLSSVLIFLSLLEEKSQKFFRKIWRERKSAYLCSPFEK